MLIGTNYTSPAGTLTYISPSGGLNLQLIIPVIVGPVVLVLLLSMLVICIIICVTRSSARAKDKHLTTLLSQMETLRTPAVTEGNHSVPGICQQLSILSCCFVFYRKDSRISSHRGVYCTTSKAVGYSQ